MVTMDNVRKSILVSVIILAVSFTAMYLIRIPYSGVGESIIDAWCNLRGGCGSPLLINSTRSIIEQGASLGFFLVVIALTVISMEYRYYAALLGVSAIVFLGVMSPQLMVGSVEWDLILFLIGSMVLAYILTAMRVFEYLAVKVLEASRGRPVLLVTFLSLLSWFLAMAVGEVTSITYVLMLVFDIYRVTRYDVKPLIILSVLATNTGSVALPVGNPIGVYLAFTANLSITSFIIKALPLSLFTLGLLIVLFSMVERKYLSELKQRANIEKATKMATSFYTSLSHADYSRIKGGLAILIAFLFLVGISDNLSRLISLLGGLVVDPHSLLAFIPYLLIIVSGLIFGVSRMGEALEKGVEWPSIIFFIALFMLGYSLSWSGTASKLAYLTVLMSSWGGAISFQFLSTVILVLSAMLSSVLDNLSVIVALTPVAKTIVSMGGPTAVYWALLYGGVFGGNYTPIGSSANIIAVGLSEKNRINIGWAEWLKIALLTTTTQIIVSIAWALTVASW
jgi:Na+/H+ antiporter NhaD/arsenite permease-like protein